MRDYEELRRLEETECFQKRVQEEADKEVEHFEIVQARLKHRRDAIAKFEPEAKNFFEAFESKTRKQQDKLLWSCESRFAKIYREKKSRASDEEEEQD